MDPINNLESKQSDSYKEFIVKEHAKELLGDTGMNAVASLSVTLSSEEDTTITGLAYTYRQSNGGLIILGGTGYYAAQNIGYGIATLEPVTSTNILNSEEQKRREAFLRASESFNRASELRNEDRKKEEELAAYFEEGADPEF